ncbi:hypothetical protein QVD17_00727 [Tagetes erecta]|uniref:Uncharacterized protein n=1 Tax=Tagetes erecta TaxID=13708 RepID=A0AAD8P7G9_TARER|nr:hypothetical protein QVD17_00727 [Tagetes erecta]
MLVYIVVICVLDRYSLSIDGGKNPIASSDLYHLYCAWGYGSPKLCGFDPHLFIWAPNLTKQPHAKNYKNNRSASFAISHSARAVIIISSSPQSLKPSINLC